MANEREEGLAALQNGDFAAAQTKLEAAVASDPRDAQAHLYLGGVYHQQGRHADAARVLTTSTELLPMSGQAQYNLGIALESLGSHQQALDAYRKANALQDNYLLAQQGMERMQKALQSAPPTGMYGAPAAPAGYEATTNTTAYAAPAYEAAPAAQPYMQDQTQPVSPYAAPPVQPGYAQPATYGQPQQYDLAGNPVETPQAPYGQAAPGGYAPPPGPNGYQGQQWSPYPTQGQMAKEDRFDVAQAFKDWLQIIIAPVRFFDGEEGAAGFSAPLSQLLAYSVIAGLAYFVFMAIFGAGMGMGIGFAAIALVVMIPLMFVFMALGFLIWAGIVHLASRMFGGSGEYSGTFRATVYSYAPGMMLGCIMLCVMGLFMPKPMTATGMAEPQVRLERAQYTNPSPRPTMGQPSFGRPGYGSPTYGSPGFGSPYSRNSNRSSSQMPAGMGALMAMQGVNMLINLVALIWSAILLGMGVRATQRMSTGSAAGTVVVSYVILIAIGVALVFGMAALVFGAAAGMR